ncbi:MAG: AbgT family transporter, partial [Pseudomonadota bacterium]
HPATLFAIALAIVMACSAIAATLGWSVSKPALDSLETGQGVLITANNLLSSNGIWWLASHLVSNFIEFPPLGIVLVGMLGIGVAERSGFIPTLLSRLAAGVPNQLLTPAIMFLGIISSVGLDAGYVVLPPIAAALYIAAGRSPLAGIAVSFAGISAGFSANVIITAIDPLLAGFTQAGARFVAPAYQVAATANWWFMAVSAVLLTGVGWVVSARFVEPRLVHDIAASVDDKPTISAATSSAEDKALKYALVSLGLLILIVLVAINFPGGPLAGQGKHFARWIETTVPIIFLLFFLPAVVYGFISGVFKSERDVADSMGATISALGPYIVLAFFAAQFIEAFKYSRLGEMLAITGGQFLVELGLPTGGLIVGFIIIVMLGNLLIGSASAKYAFFAPVFVPMLMYVGISPELTQAAYRVGDSTTNIITPLNPYMIIIVALVQRYRPNAGVGSIVSMMLPYTLAFAIVWMALLLLWIGIDMPLGPGGPLHYQISTNGVQ